MAEPSQRASRSRYSSPFATPHNAATAKSVSEPAEKPRTFLDKWIEPQLAPARPSFAEAGIERHGVVANMAPLGTRPSAKVLKASTRPEPMPTTMAMETTTRSSARRANQSSVSTPSEAISTPEPTINMIRRRSLSSKAETQDQMPQTPPQQQQTPTPQTPQTSARKSVPRPSTATAGGQQQGQGVFALQHSPLPLGTPRHSMSSFIPPCQFGPNGEYRVDLDMTDRVVESAVQEALDNQRWPTAYALRTLYDDHRMNPRMVRLIDTIYNGRADENQLKEFKGVMKHKKKEGKKDRTGEYYFNGDGSDPLPGPAQFTPVPTRTPSFSGPLGRPTTGGARGNISSTSASISASASASPQKETEHISKKHKTNRFPALSLDLNGDGTGHVKASPQKHHHHQNGSVRHRAASNTSSSSLSSVDEHLINNNDYHTSPAGLRAHPPSRSAPSARSAAHAETHPGARLATRPISGPKETGPKTYTFSTVTPSSSSHHRSSTAHDDDDDGEGDADDGDDNVNIINRINSNRTAPHARAGDVIAPGGLLALTSSQADASSSAAATAAQSRGRKGDPSKAAGRAFDENDPAVRMKRKARDVTDRSVPVLESFERRPRPGPGRGRGRGRRRGGGGGGPGRDSESASERGASEAPFPPPPPPPLAASSSAPPKQRTTLRLLNNNKKTRQSLAAVAGAGAGYESDSHSSPTLLSFQPDLAPGSLSVSRAGTPSAFGRPVRKPKTGTGLRVKTSPMKKKGGGPLAGIPRQSGERSPTGNGAGNNMDDNDDYCCACGGIGDLVCCDGCTRSFHFNCVDPPMKETALPDEWFCKVCYASRVPHRESERGLFGNLNSNLEKKNPISFHLPKDIREYFVDVKTGPEGEYDEGAPPKPKNRIGYEEAPDYFRLKDTKGKTILCHQCHRSASAPDRAVIPCTYCGLFWHLDCLEIPLAKEPGPGRPFRCPAHIDDLLMTLPHTLAPAHRFRKIKGASAIRPAVARGIQNNGHIEIENDQTDDEKELGFYEQREYGHVYKLPEMGIKLDFISQVRRKTAGGYAPVPPTQTQTPAPTPQPGTSTPPTTTTPSSSFDQRSLMEQQAVLNLASLSIPYPEIGDPQMLIDALLSEASPAILALIAQADATNLAESKLEMSKDRNALVALRALIDSKLAAFSDAPEEKEVEEEEEANEEAETGGSGPEVEMDDDDVDDGGEREDENEVEKEKEVGEEKEDGGKKENEDKDGGEGEGEGGAVEIGGLDGDTEMSDEVEG